MQSPRHPDVGVDDVEVDYIEVDKHELLDLLDLCLDAADLASLQTRVSAFRSTVAGTPVISLPAVPHPGASGNGADALMLRRDILLEELDQIATARTLRRARYYLERLHKSATETRVSAVNDINLNRWKEYDEILTDSLWTVEKRDSTGAHGAWYWGNFIPQIPRQLMLRYTKAGDWVLDPFLGSGTTLIECRRLGRHGIGVELNADVARRASEVIKQEPNPHGVTTAVTQGDSATIDFEALLDDHGVPEVQLVLLHPPYHDIIRFGDSAADLSNATTVDGFVEQFGAIAARAMDVLAGGRYLAVVIGDKYEDGEWIPLGFRTMQAVLNQGCTLKSIVVKNLNGTRAKRDQQALWRYRALVAGFYVFKHEYIFIFQK